MTQRPIQKPKSITLPKWAWMLFGFLALSGGLAILVGAVMSCGADR